MIGNLFDFKSLASPAQGMSGSISQYLESLKGVIEQAGGEQAPEDLKNAMKQVEQCDANARDCAHAIENGTLDQNPIVLDDPPEEPYAHPHAHEFPDDTHDPRTRDDDSRSLEDALNQGIPVAGGGSPSVPEAVSSATEARGRASGLLAEARAIYQKSLLPPSI